MTGPSDDAQERVHAERPLQQGLNHSTCLWIGSLFVLTGYLFFIHYITLIGIGSNPTAGPTVPRADSHTLETSLLPETQVRRVLRLPTFKG